MNLRQNQSKLLIYLFSSKTVESEKGPSLVLFCFLGQPRVARGSLQSPPALPLPHRSINHIQDPHPQSVPTTKIFN